MSENNQTQADQPEQEAPSIADAAVGDTPSPAEEVTHPEIHPGHAIIDEIQRVTKVQHAREWLHEKLEELRKLLP